MTMIRDSDWLYTAITIPWLSQDPVAVVFSSGQGFCNVFDNERRVEADASNSLAMEGWEFVGLWQAAFPGLNMIAWVVFRKRNSSRFETNQVGFPT
jgi:hypothetical protein